LLEKQQYTLIRWPSLSPRCSIFGMPSFCHFHIQVEEFILCRLIEPTGHWFIWATQSGWSQPSEFGQLSGTLPYLWLPGSPDIAYQRVETWSIQLLENDPSLSYLHIDLESKHNIIPSLDAPWMMINVGTTTDSRIEFQ
jgi:hypothetical protein